MPQCDGLKATRLIKAERPETTIVMLTVSEEEQDLFEAIKSGAQGYLLKSLDSETFLKMLSGIARGEPAISRSMAWDMLQAFASQERCGDQPADEGLTSREREVLQWVVDGASNKEIAVALSISEHTVKYHLRNILEKLHLQPRAGRGLRPAAWPGLVSAGIHSARLRKSAHYCLTLSGA